MTMLEENRELKIGEGQAPLQFLITVLFSWKGGGDSLLKKVENHKKEDRKSIFFTNIY